jgi:hypothetical protein
MLSAQDLNPSPIAEFTRYRISPSLSRALPSFARFLLQLSFPACLKLASCMIRNETGNFRQEHGEENGSHKLENQTHHDTTEPIELLGKFSISPPTASMCQAFWDWSKNGRKVYDRKDSAIEFFIIKSFVMFDYWLFVFVGNVKCLKMPILLGLPCVSARQ